jgi:hypothetical protein
MTGRPLRPYFDLHMATWRTKTTAPGPPDRVLAVLTDPNEIERWSPVPFEVEELGTRRLQAGSRARVTGRFAGQRVAFDVEVLSAHDGRLELSATGPIELDVIYELRNHPDGSELHAEIAVRGRGLGGRLLAQACDAVLAAGALHAAVDRIAAATA